MLNNYKLAALLTTAALFVGWFFVGCNTSSEASGPTTTPEPVHSQMSDMPMKSSNTTPTKPANANEVVIENFVFAPAVLTVKAGTKVTWVNRDDEPHTATDDDRRFNSKTLDTNDQFTFTFTQPGTYNYFCALHPKMRGQIVVK